MIAPRFARHFQSLFALALVIAGALSPTVAQAQTAGTSYLGLNNYLTTNQYLVSPNKLSFLVLQGDGNLVQYMGSGPANNLGSVWSTGRTGAGGKFCLLSQGDGNLCVYPGENPSQHTGPALWCSGQHPGIGSYFTALQDDGNLVTYRGTPAAPGGYVWGSGARVTAAQVLGKSELADQNLLVTGSKLILQTTAATCDYYAQNKPHNVAFVADFIQVGGDFTASRVWTDVQTNDLLTVDKVGTACGGPVFRLRAASGQYVAYKSGALAMVPDAASATTFRLDRTRGGSYWLAQYSMGDSCDERPSYFYVNGGYCGSTISSNSPGYTTTTDPRNAKLVLGWPSFDGPTSNAFRIFALP